MTKLNQDAEPSAIAPVRVQPVVGLCDAIRTRESAKQKVINEVQQHTNRGELVTNGQMPSWPEYQEACRQVEKLEAEIAQPNDGTQRSGGQ